MKETNINIENMKINLKNGIKILKKNTIRGKCSGVPQVAFLMETKSNKLVGKQFINMAFKDKCKEEWMETPEETHAEVRVMKYAKDNFIIEKDKSYSLVVSSHPCESCILMLKQFEDIIDNVYYMSKSSYKKKVKNYNSLAEENGYKKFEEISINFQHFNAYQDSEIDQLVNYYIDRLNDYLTFNLNVFYRTIKKNLKDGKSSISIEKYKEWLYYLEICEKVLDRRVYTVQKEKVKIEYEDIIQNKKIIYKYMQFSNENTTL